MRGTGVDSNALADPSEQQTWWSCTTRMSRALQELSAEDLRHLVRAIDRRQRASAWTKAELAWFVARTTVSRFFGPRNMLGVLTMARHDSKPFNPACYQLRLPTAA